MYLLKNVPVQCAIAKVATALLFKVEVGQIFKYSVYSKVSQHSNLLLSIQIFIITIFYV